MTDEEQGKKNADSLRQEGETLIRIATALRDLPAEAQCRVLLAVAALCGIDPGKR